MNTVAFETPSIFARIKSFFTTAVEIIREARELRASFGGRYIED